MKILVHCIRVLLACFAGGILAADMAHAQTASLAMAAADAGGPAESIGLAYPVDDGFPDHDGEVSSSSKPLTAVNLGGVFAGHAMCAGNVYYFAFGGPDRIERYDLVVRGWLEPIALQAAATALWADESAVFVAEDRTVVRFGLDGGGRIAMGTAAATVKCLLTLNDVLVFGPSDGDITTMNKRSGAALSTVSYRCAGTGYSVVPSLNRVFFRSINDSPSDIKYLEIAADGKFVKGSDSPYQGTYADATRTFVFPNGARVVDDSGTIYSTDSLSYNNSFTGSFTDLCFFGADVPIVLRGNKLIGYSNTLIEKGSFVLNAVGLRVAVAGTDALVFSADATNDHGIGVQSVPLTAIAAPQPGEPIDPRGLAYTPDDIFVDRDGNLLLLCKSQLSVFRWSPAELKYLTTLPLQGAPLYAGYSGSDHRAYFAYSQSVRTMDLAAVNPQETPLFNLPGPVMGFTLAGEFPFVTVEGGPRTFSPTGQLLSSGTNPYGGRLNIWDPVNRRVYHFRDGISPNDLHYETIDATGRITGTAESPYNGGFAVTGPIRISPDGATVVIGSGVVFKAADLTKTALLANGVVDAAWMNGDLSMNAQVPTATPETHDTATLIAAVDGDDELFSIRLNSGMTQVRRELQSLPGSTAQFRGTPLRLFALDLRRFLLVTMIEGAPRFTILNELLEPIYASPTKPLPAANLAVMYRTHTSVALHWDDSSDNEDGFRIECRLTGGVWAVGSTVAANVTTGTVAGLAPDRSYEFRLVASDDVFSSTPSAVVTAQTLSTDQPVGEPYNLRVTRVFKTSITLEWQDNASNETGFRILRSITPGGATTEFMAAAGATSFAADGLSGTTAYYFRIQAVNGAVAGDLSAEVNATTRSSDVVPVAPSTLTLTPTATTVSVTWKDNSLNEETFTIERSTSPVTSWVQVGSVPFNTTVFTDATVAPYITYTYRVKATNGSGSSNSTVKTVTTLPAGGYLTTSMRAGDVYYFAFSGPNRIERYDLAARNWLEPIALQGVATALWVDESAVFVAEGRTVVRFALDGGDRTVMGTAAANVDCLFTLKEVLGFGPSGGNLTTMNKRSGDVLATITAAGTGCSVVPALNRVFMRSTYGIYYLEIGADGKLINSANSLYLVSGSRTFAFPNGLRLVDNLGTVYSTESLSHDNRFADSFTDLCFRGVDVPILIRGNQLISYANTLVERGSFELDAPGLRVAVDGADALVFCHSGTSMHGLVVQSVPLTAINAPQPGEPINPQGLAYTPDDAFIDRDGNLLLLCKSQLGLFRWSPAELKYLTTLPLGGMPRFAGYSGNDHRAYLGYESQGVRVLDLTAENPQEVPLISLPGTLEGFTMAGEFPYAALVGGPRTFSPAGELLSTLSSTLMSQTNVWDPVNRRVYHFHDEPPQVYVPGETPSNNLYYDTIDATGRITGTGETPYSGAFAGGAPIRVSPDGATVVVGSGDVFRAADLTRIATVATNITDALWQTNELLTIRASGSQTQLQRWNATTFAAGASVPLFTGAPVRLLALNSERSLLITLDRGMPRYFILNADLTISSDYQPDAPRISGTPPTAPEDLAFSWTPEVWKFSSAASVTVSAPVLPGWLRFSDGVLSGTPGEADTGDQLNRSKVHRVVLHAVDSLGLSEDREFAITALWQNDPPGFASGPSPVEANDRADDSQLDLGALVVDPDGNDPHRWGITGNGNPLIFSNITIDDQGLLRIVYAPYVSGTSTVTVQVSDASGAFATTAVEVVLPELPVPQVTADPEIQLNEVTGLYEQSVTVTNVAARAIAGFDLTISGLRAGVQLYNGTVIEAGGGVIAYHHPMDAGASITMVIEYIASPRGPIPPPSFSTGVTLPDPISNVGIDGAAVFAINRIFKQADGSFVIEFTAIPGGNYRMQYSDDATHWKVCPAAINAAGTKVQWLDRGPPGTDSSPTTQPRRFYRVERSKP